MSNNLNRYFEQDENVSVLSVTTGQLTVAKIPVIGAADWIVPQSLVLAINPYHERIWTYIWKDQDVPVYHLLPKSATPTQLVILESVTDIHRIALQIQGEVTFHSVRIADLKDADTATYQAANAQYSSEVLAAASTHHQPADQANTGSLTAQTVDDNRANNSYIYQPVVLAGEVCVVPNLDKLSHFLVDLDSY